MGKDDDKPDAPILAYAQGELDPASRARWRVAFILLAALYGTVAAVGFMIQVWIEPGSVFPSNFLVAFASWPEIPTTYCLLASSFLALEGFRRRSQGRSARTIFRIHLVLQPTLVVGYVLVLFLVTPQYREPIRLQDVVKPMPGFASCSIPFFVLLIRAVRVAAIPRKIEARMRRIFGRGRVARTG